MSKARVTEALLALHRSDADAAMTALVDVEATFIQKRLRHLIASDSEQATLARELWKLLVTQTPPSTEPSRVEPPTAIHNDAAPPVSSESRTPPRRWTLDTAEEVLAWLEGDPRGTLNLGDVDFAQIWGLTALAALGRQETPDRLRVLGDPSTGAGRFAHAVGIDDLIRGRAPEQPGEPGRTVKLRRFTEFPEVERTASRISSLLFPDSDRDESEDESEKVVRYVLVELLRNVVQHSRDALGGVAAAQLMERGMPYADYPCVQVVVADCGIGIFEALKETHPDLADSRTALEKALHPHISGTFEEGFTGSGQNAGMGLFFIAEMAKLAGGRLLIASRGAVLSLEASLDNPDDHEISFLGEPSLGFAGTIVAFELPVGGVGDYDSLLEVIRKRARDRTPRRATHSWLRFDRAPENAATFLVRMSSEDTSAAEAFARDHLLPRILRREPIVLDFRHLDITTQSYVHALLFEPLRVAWALKTRVYAVNANAAVRSTLELLENYALSG